MTGTFCFSARMCLSAAWLLCLRSACRLYQRWMVTADWFTCWMNLDERTAVSLAADHERSRDGVQWSDLSASSSVTSLLRGGTGLLRGPETGDLVLEVEEKFFWDFVTELFSSKTSSLAVAFRMLLKNKL